MKIRMTSSEGHVFDFNPGDRVWVYINDTSCVPTVVDFLDEDKTPFQINMRGVTPNGPKHCTICKVEEIR